MIPLYLHLRSARPSPVRDGHGSPDDHIDDVVGRVVQRLRQAGRPLHSVELDALANEIVLDVSRFVLRWQEGDGADVAQLCLADVRGGDARPRIRQ